MFHINENKQIDMKLELFIDIMAWICLIYWLVYIPDECFSLSTNPFLASIAIILLFWRCFPYILQLEEYD